MSHVLAVMQSLAKDKEPEVVRDGTIVGGSYDPSDGTVEVLQNDTYAMFTDGADATDQPVTKKVVPVLTPAYGLQYGPVGNERVAMIPAQSGFFAAICYGPDDSPGAPSGETWIVHRNPADGSVNAYTKWTNDGAQTNDAAGGKLELVGTKWNLKTAAGLQIQIDDQTGRVQIGAVSLSATDDRVVRYKDLHDVVVTIVNYINAHKHTGVSTGAGISGTVQPPTLSVTPTASQTVFAKS